MTSKKNQKEMLEYLVEKLSSSNETKAFQKEIIPGIKSNYIKVGGEDIVFLVDKVYPNESIREFNKRAHESNLNVVYVILKDGENFFRSAARNNYFKKSNMLSLKNYSNEDLNKMILFRPEESFISMIRGYNQYYQPSSPRKNECIVNYKFEPVHFDYSHIDPYEKFKPTNKNSEKLNIWTKNKELFGDLKVDEKYLIEKK